MIYVYSCDPIDWWAGWMTEAEFLRHVHTTQCSEPSMDFSNPVIDEYVNFTTRAYELARQVGWEGDIRKGCGPFVAGIPEPGNYEKSFIVGWKQDNKGTTFVASPRELDWLKTYWWASADDTGNVTFCDEMLAFNERMEHYRQKRENR